MGCPVLIDQASKTDVGDIFHLDQYVLIKFEKDEDLVKTGIKNKGDCQEIRQRLQLWHCL